MRVLHRDVRLFLESLAARKRKFSPFRPLPLMMQVPCEGNGDASLEVEYCFAWQELAPGVSNICKGVDGVVRSSSTSECGCGSFVVDEVKVCPVSSILWTESMV